jgi:predicted amidohydrolase
VPVFKLYGFCIAVFICNDLWHPSLPYLGVCQKADVFITIFSSSEGSMGSEFSNIESWGIINTFYSRIFGIYNICANRVGDESVELNRTVRDPSGDQDESGEALEQVCERMSYHFWGGSEIINPFGQHMAKASLHSPDEISAEISRDLLRKKRILLPYLRNDDPFFTHRELQRILYHKLATT